MIVNDASVWILSFTPQLKISLISLWRWVAWRPYKVLSIISNNKKISLVDPSWGNIPSFDLESYDAKFDTTVILETEFHENNNNFTSHPDNHKHNWKIVSTINVLKTQIFSRFL